MKRNAKQLACLWLFQLLFSGSTVFGAVAHDEEADGDLSGNYAAPTLLNLQPGSNVVAGLAGVFDTGDDLDYLNVKVPAGYQLSELQLLLYVGQDPTAFVGVQEGDAFTFPADEAFGHIYDMIGWSHIGPGAGHGVGSDLLPSLGVNGQGFVPPLTGPSYTFWIQQTGNVMDYQLDFVVTPGVPEPASCLLLASALGLIAARRRPRCRP